MKFPRSLKIIFIVFVFILSASCNNPVTKNNKEKASEDSLIKEVSFIVLGTVQDGGSPHTGCKKDCCRDLFLNPDPERKVVSLGIIDPQNKKCYLFEATPDLPVQMKNLRNHCAFSNSETPDGIFLTHAHIGHYTGLMYLGKEVMNTKQTPVYTMPRMKTFLEENGPWSQLVRLQNISLLALKDSDAVVLTSNIKVTPFKVPHRDEYSETVGYFIEGPHKKLLFIPDIDKWEKWDTDIIEAISKVDYAFIDGTFFDGEEINTRNIAEIPHPFISESMEKFKSLSSTEKGKIYFIHFNHTNPILNPSSTQSVNVLKNGFNIARMNMVIQL